MPETATNLLEQFSQVGHGFRFLLHGAGCPDTRIAGLNCTRFCTSAGRVPFLLTLLLKLVQSGPAAAAERKREDSAKTLFSDGGLAVAQEKVAHPGFRIAAIMPFIWLSFSFLRSTVHFRCRFKSTVGCPGANSRVAMVVERKSGEGRLIRRRCD